MQNTQTQNQIFTPETGAEYLRRLATDTREAGQSATAFDIEAAADKIEQQEKLLTELRLDMQAIIDSRREDNERLAAGIMSVIGDSVEAIAESAAQKAASDVLENDFNIHDYEYEITDMIDERLPDNEDREEAQREAVESIVKEVLAGATLTIDI